MSEGHPTDDKLEMNGDWSSTSNPGDEPRYEDLEHETAASQESSESENDGSRFPMHVFIETDNISAAKKMLEVRNESKMKFLQAIQNGKQMIEKDGGDVPSFLRTFGTFKDVLNERDVEGQTPLHYAILRRKLEFVQAFVAAGCDLNLKLDGVGLLHLAFSVATVRTEQNIRFAAEAIDIILKAGASIVEIDDLRRNIFHIAAEFNLSDEIDLVFSFISQRSEASQSFPVDLFFQQDIFGRSCFHTAFRSGAVTILKTLIAFIKNIHSTGFQKFQDHLTSDVDHEGNTCLRLAKNSREMLEFISTSEHFQHIPKMSEVPDEDESRPRGTTKLITHEIFRDHLTIEKHKVDTVKYKLEVPCENVNRLEVLVNKDYGILNSTKFSVNTSFSPSKKAEIGDILRVHEYSYVDRLRRFCEEIPEGEIRNLDGDTTVSSESFNAALYAAGSVCQGIDLVLSSKAPCDKNGSKRQRIDIDSSNAAPTSQNDPAENVFCIVRPPGHHAGSCGAVSEEPDGGSYGFCLLNNVAIGAAYARHIHRDKVRKVAIIDFDVHHGNGTEECVRNVIPHVKNITLGNRNIREKVVRQKTNMRYDVIKQERENEIAEKKQKIKGKKNIEINLLEPAIGCMEISIKEERYMPWLNGDDHRDTFFVSIHGFGRRFPSLNTMNIPDHVPASQLGTFYPASGETYLNVPENEKRESNESTLNGDSSKFQKHHNVYEPNIINFGQKTQSIEEWKQYWTFDVLPELVKFDPDLILISAGFDAHKKDEINMGYIGVTEYEYFWLTKELVKVANTCCEGRVVSVLEGGYNVAGGIVSPFAKSVAAHVEALAETKRTEKWKDPGKRPPIQPEVSEAASDVEMGMEKEEKGAQEENVPQQI